MSTALEKPTTASPTDELPSNPAIFYDRLSYAAYDHPHEVYRQLRDEGPVYYNALRDPSGSSPLRRRQRLPEEPRASGQGARQRPGWHPRLLRHRQPGRAGPAPARVLRTVVRPSFAAREILTMEEHIRVRVRELLVGLRERGLRRSGGGDLRLGHY